MDATALALVKKLHKIERQIREWEDDAQSIKTALELIGIKPEDHPLFPETREDEYALKRPFAHKGLIDSCKRILTDHPNQPFTKSHVEYLVTRGGYKFETENPKNSVDVTLRRLAADGFCKAERIRGSAGSTYTWVGKEEG